MAPPAPASLRIQPMTGLHLEPLIEPGDIGGRPSRQLRVLHAVAITLGVVIGAGIFRTSPNVAAAVGSDLSLYALWILGGALSVVGALCFAELAGAFPDAGGDYHFLRLAFGQRVGFLFAWSRFAVIHTGSMALLAFVFGDYLNELIHLGPMGAPCLAAATILALMLVNLRGVRLGAGAQVALIALVMLGLASVIASAVWFAWQGLSSLTPVGAPAAPADAPDPGKALVFVFLAYGGWSDAATLSAEMRDRRRGILYALIVGMGLVVLLYVATNWAFLRVLGLSGMAASHAPAADLMQAVFGTGGKIVIVGVVALTSISVMNATLITAARTTYAAARDVPSLRRFLGVWNSSRGTPSVAMLAIGTVALMLVGFGTFTRGGFATMVDYMSPVYWGFLILSGTALIVLRVTRPHAPRSFRVPLYPFLPLLFIASSAYVLQSSIAYVRAGALAGLGVLGVGALLLTLVRHRRRRPHG
jgi:basic amino acid/polyamine antiporter, APA family